MATIGQEPKIRMAEENFILLPKKKTIVSVCMTNVRSYVCLFISRSHLLHQCLVLNFLLATITENVSFACFNTSIPKNPNQSRQLTVLTMPDSVLCSTFVTSQNLITKCLR